MNDSLQKIFSIDLGLRTAAGAEFDGQSCRLSKGFLWKTDPEESRGPKAWKSMVGEIQNTIKMRGVISRFTTIIMEWPQVYRQKHGYGKDLLELSAVGGGVVSVFSEVDHQLYEASEWTRSRPKGPNQKRILRHLEDGEIDRLASSLDEEPESIKQKVQNEKAGQIEHVIDAVGIGLYHLRRM